MVTSDYSHPQPSSSSLPLRVAVTGGSGQLGTLLLRRLAAHRKISALVSIDLRPPVFTSSKVQVEHADVRDREIGRYFKDCDVVVHLAFLLSGYYDREVFNSVNVEGSKNVFRQAVAAGVKHLVFCSSVAAYGVVPGHPLPLVEESPRHFQPDFAYSAAKYQVEKFLDDLERDHPELLISRVRPAVLLGAYMPNVFGAMLRRRLIPDPGGPMQFVWDEDVADAIVQLILKSIPGAFNLAAEEPLTAKQLGRECGLRTVARPPLILARPFAQLSRLAERMKLGYSFDPAWLKFAGIVMVMSSDKAREKLGWKPRFATSLQVLKGFLKTVPQRTSRPVLWFFRAVYLNGRFGPMYPEMVSMNLNILLHLTGPDGGDFSIHVANGRLIARRGIHGRAQSIVTLSADLFRRLLQDRASWSTQQMTGNILAEGQAHGSLVVAALIANFVAQTRKRDWSTMVPRALQRWIASANKD